LAIAPEQREPRRPSERPQFAGTARTVAARARAWLPAWAFPLGLVYLFFGVFQRLNLFDEGLILVGAERVAHGAVPYRDFAAYYTPAQFYTLAGIFHVFGSSILAERTWDTIVRFGVCVLVFLVARTMVSRKAAYVPFVVAVLLLGCSGWYAYPVVPAMFWALAAILILARSWPSNEAPYLLFAGLATGLSALYRQDIGAYAFASVTIALLILPPGQSRTARRGRVNAIGRLKPLVWYGLGTCILILPALAYFLREVPLGELRAQFLEFPRLHAQSRSLPLPPIVPGASYLLSSALLQGVWFLFYAPLVVYLVSAAGLLRAVSGSAAEPGKQSRRFGQTLLTLFGSMLLTTTVTRADLVHCLAPTIPATVLFVAMLANRPRSRAPAWATPLVAFCLVVLALPYGLAPIARWAQNLRDYAPWRQTSSLPRARYFHVDHDEEQTARFIQEHVPESQAIFVGNAQHRRVFANDAMLYFLAERRPGTRFDDFEPGVVTTAPVQRRMIREIEGNHVGYVVLFSGFESNIRENAPSEGGAAILDDFLRSRYQEVRVFGSYTILARSQAQEGQARRGGEKSQKPTPAHASSRQASRPRALKR
jgi:hypothetical protein